VNEEFEARLVTNPHLSKYSGRMFFICDGKADSRPGLLVSNGCIMMFVVGTTLWTVSALTLVAKWECY
jgi:hypothetical protein